MAPKDKPLFEFMGKISYEENVNDDEDDVTDEEVQVTIENVIPAGRTKEYEAKMIERVIGQFIGPIQFIGPEYIPGKYFTT